MRILVAMDAFKGTLTAVEACDAVRSGILDVRPDIDVKTVPLADGGEGTAAVTQALTGGEWVTETVCGPLPDSRVEARWLWGTRRCDKGALVEMAEASGLQLLRPEQYDPMRATSYGTGELLRAALDRGADRIWLAVGGSATVDCGVGAAQALGWRFLDDAGDEVGMGGRVLDRIRHIEPPDPDPFDGVHLFVLCDVSNRLVGREGAAEVYAPQKGASPEEVRVLTAGLRSFAELVERELGVDIGRPLAGGAAGGMGAMAMGLWGAKALSGSEWILDAAWFETVIARTDLTVLGEGRFDRQSFGGKVLGQALGWARITQKPVVILAGQVGTIQPEWTKGVNLQAMIAASPDQVPEPEQAATLLRQAARDWAATL